MMSRNTVSWTLVTAVIAVAISLAFTFNFYGDREWYRSLTVQDYSHLEEVRTQVEEMVGKKNALIVLTDGRVLHVREMEVGRVEITSAIDHPILWAKFKDLKDDKFLLQVQRLVAPADPLFPQYAARFVTQNK